RTPYDRGAILKRAADLIRAQADCLARTTVLESGKPVAQARAEWLVAADLFEWFAEEGKRAYGRVVPSRIGTRRLTVLKQPIGVVRIITAWNFPAYNVARAAAAALAAGCASLRSGFWSPAGSWTSSSIASRPWSGRSASDRASIRKRRSARSSTRGSAIASRASYDRHEAPARPFASAARGRRIDPAATSTRRPSSPTCSHRCRCTRRRSSDRSCR